MVVGSSFSRFRFREGKGRENKQTNVRGRISNSCVADEERLDENYVKVRPGSLLSVLISDHVISWICSPGACDSPAGENTSGVWRTRNVHGGHFPVLVCSSDFVTPPYLVYPFLSYHLAYCNRLADHLRELTNITMLCILIAMAHFRVDPIIVM